MQFPDSVTRLCGLKRFSFGCHPQVSCFTECCRELELVLSPYDVLRLCRALQTDSGTFIDRHVVIEQDAKNGFPVLYLGMVDDGRASCPFISKKGCLVYNGRPGACRAYPVGRGATLDDNGRKQELHVLVREDHCQGFSEASEFTAAEWFENQGLAEYNSINDEMLTLVQHDLIQEGMKLSRAQHDKVLKTLYRLDIFRELVSSEAFQIQLQLDDGTVNDILKDDISLLRFGIKWLEQDLFTESND
jgi:Fe-S-cluster containining protein